MDEIADTKETIKKWWESKMVWLAVFTTVVGIADFMYETFAGGGDFEWQNVFLIVSGVAAVILRVWFTDTAIE